MLPTIAEIGGAAAQGKVDGISVTRAFRGGSLPAGRVFYWEFHEGGFNRAVRFGDWKAIQFGKDGPIELYNLKTDLGEATDVAAANPGAIAEARRHFAASRVENPNFPMQDGAANSPNRARRN
jgi:arylsulfatase A-like enzyme